MLPLIFLKIITMIIIILINPEQYHQEIQSKDPEVLLKIMIWKIDYLVHQILRCLIVLMIWEMFNTQHECKKKVSVLFVIFFWITHPWVRYATENDIKKKLSDRFGFIIGILYLYSTNLIMKPKFEISQEDVQVNRIHLISLVCF